MMMMWVMTDDGECDDGGDFGDDDCSLLCQSRSPSSIFQLQNGSLDIWLLEIWKFSSKSDFWTFEHFPWNLTFLLLQPAADTSATGYGPPAEEYGAPSSSYGSAYSRSVRILCPMISSILGFNYLYYTTCSKLNIIKQNPTEILFKFLCCNFLWIFLSNILRVSTLLWKWYRIGVPSKIMTLFHHIIGSFCFCVLHRKQPSIIYAPL